MIATLAGGGIALPGLAQMPVGLGGVEALSPVLILVLCVVAGIGTVLLLPARRQPGLHGIGAALLIAAGLILLAVLVHWAGGPAGAAGRAGMGVYFWIFAAIAVVGAMRVISHPRPVYSALYFVLTVFASAGLFVLLWADFMAAALVLIYAGAILITYVFVIMLATQARNPRTTTISPQGAEYDVVSREPMLASAIGFALMGVLLLVIFDRASELAPGPVAAARENAGGVLGSTQALGVYLFGNQIVTLELAGLLLTVAMVGAVLIARRRVLHTEQSEPVLEGGEVIAPMTPVSDDPHSIPVFGSDNPRQKEYPET